MENVLGLASKPIWQEFVGGLKDAGYFTFAGIVELGSTSGDH